jgi:hypothetical protein
MRAYMRDKQASSNRNHRIMLRDGFKCRYCGYDGGSSYEAFRNRGLCVDHFIPGGGDGDDNLVTACSDCNAWKARKEFPSISEAGRWLRLYRHEIAKPWYMKHVVGKQDPSTWVKREGKQRMEHFLKRFKNGEDEPNSP